MGPAGAATTGPALQATPGTALRELAASLASVLPLAPTMRWRAASRPSCTLRCRQQQTDQTPKETPDDRDQCHIKRM